VQRRVATLHGVAPESGYLGVIARAARVVVGAGSVIARARKAACMITEEDKDHIRRSWKLVIPIAETAADLFYRRLFELKPEYQSLFPEDMSGQKSKLVRMLAFIVKALDFPDSAWRDDVDESEDLLLVLLALGRRHQALYGVPREAYAGVGEALLWTLDYGLGEAFTPAVRAAWTAVYKAVSSTMILSVAASDPERSLEPAFGAGQAAIESRLKVIGMTEVGGGGPAHAGADQGSKGAVR
jgi:hemoglobin-like flavoprotein